ncbi:UvrD-helicase domain-containing protein [Aquimarina sp. 2201CG1-2-11]|uniref:UvrD-helicase domain-containing protein n=1 Tax=Aquimarina discodermiae TaxID=3231043 RepID=UPI0034637396
MNPTTPFTIYNAAAGAGKTYTLVKAYLITLLNGDFKDSYKNILALTFTNKAVAEMKIRVLENLVAISAPITPLPHQDLFNELIAATNYTEKELKQKANRILKSILHNYASFDIVTIDTFTHRVIRTFAHDLEIPMNFEIDMDTDALIEEAVDAVISKIGIDKELTRLIIDFAVSKLNEDKSWDITIELNKVARLLFSENDRKYIHHLLPKSNTDFEDLKTQLYQKIKLAKENVVLHANNALQLIKNKGVAFTDFTRSSIPNHFDKLAKGDFKVDFKAAWKQNIREATFYTTKLEDHKKGLIDTIRPEIEYAFQETKNALIQITFFENIIKNITPLSILNAINKELITIKKERKVLLISEFNNIISTAIKGQPAPFIYERLGERYRDYFIDEFQDTSEMQWQNLVPLIDNALATETLSGKRGQLTIVGDAKQAIYRWRGGKAEQFIELSSDINPFSTQEKQVLNLPKNYRSHEEIIKFNNNLFSFLSNDFSNLKHQELYLAGNKQEVNSKKGGYVDISFIEAKNAAQENDMYPQKVYETILELNEKGYQHNEICIIIRKQKEGALIADFLTQKGISIISSETLLISKAPEVNFIIDLLTWHIQQDHLQSKINVLNFLAEKYQVPDKHSFFSKLINNGTKDFYEVLKSFEIDFSFTLLATKPLYDAVAYCIRAFCFSNYNSAHLQFFLDTVFTFAQKHMEGIPGFLSYWQTKKDSLSIIAPKTKLAVQIMTIHKAKGLEFPCVIYPYANIDIYEEIEPKTWIEVDKDQYNGFGELLINYNKKISDYGTDAEKIVVDRQSQLELDTFNLLYVVFTRAREQLYVISNLKINYKGESNPNTFSGKLINYLKHLGVWETQNKYTFGSPLKPSNNTIKENNTLKTISLSKSTQNTQPYKVFIVTNAGKLWDTEQQYAIEKGNLIHELMASVYVHDDIQTVLDEAYLMGKITFPEKEILHKELIKVVEHPELSPYFSDDSTIFNEREIFSNGKSFRPDRIIIDPNNIASIIDYKTGSYDPYHRKQLEEYTYLLETTGYIVRDRILVYFNKDIKIKRV